MKRRKAISKIGIGLSAGMFLPGLLGSCDNDDGDTGKIYDGLVVIIGAGAAGLCVAHHLIARGVNVKILEADNVAGGRVRSIRGFSDFPVELGADRIFGSDGAWTKMVKDTRVPFAEFIEEAIPKFLIEGKLVAESEEINSAQRFLSDLRGYTGGGASLKQIMLSAGLSSASQAFVNSWIVGRLGVDAESIEARAVAQSLSAREGADQEFVLQGNPQQDLVLSCFSSALPFIQYETQVKQVNWQRDNIIITDQDGNEIEATKVVITVPVSILKKGLITFSPNLPNQKTTALGRIEMSPAIKLVMDFNRNFWGQDTSFILGGTSVPHYFNAGIKRSQSRRIIHALIVGNKALELSDMGEEAVLSKALEELDKAYNGDASRNLKEKYFYKDWLKEPFIQGGYSYSKVGGTNSDRIAIAAPLNKKLFFAGEATDFNGDFGTMNGAIASGIRCADEIIESILADKS